MKFRIIRRVIYLFLISIGLVLSGCAGVSSRTPPHKLPFDNTFVTIAVKVAERVPLRVVDPEPSKDPEKEAPA